MIKLAAFGALQFVIWSALYMLLPMLETDTVKLSAFVFAGLSAIVMLALVIGRPR